MLYQVGLVGITKQRIFTVGAASTSAGKIRRRYLTDVVEDFFLGSGKLSGRTGSRKSFLIIKIIQSKTNFLRFTIKGRFGKKSSGKSIKR